jgi:hypothetical protein
VVRDLTVRYWDMVQQADQPTAVFKAFCRELDFGDLASIREPSIFISNHLTVIEPLKVLVNQSYSLPYHSLLLDYLIEQYTGRPVSHISTNPQTISPLLQRAAERLGFLLIEPKMSPRDLGALSRRVADTLKEGTHISVAPEGHFHAWDAVGPFKRGFYHWARDNSSTVVPVRLSGFETLGPRLEFRFASAEFAPQSSTSTEFVNDIRERVFGRQFGLRLL